MHHDAFQKGPFDSLRSRVTKLSEHPVHETLIFALFGLEKSNSGW
jgi:hypothetical protein